MTPICKNIPEKPSFKMYKTGVLFSENSISEYIPIQEPKGLSNVPQY